MFHSHATHKGKIVNALVVVVCVFVGVIAASMLLRLKADDRHPGEQRFTLGLGKSK